MYVCMYVCMYACMHACMYCICMHACMYYICPITSFPILPVHPSLLGLAFTGICINLAVDTALLLTTNPINIDP